MRSMLLKLIAGEPELRRAAGEANREFVAAFLSDRRRMAGIMSTHLVEIVSAARRA
jgi:hypothetical protein